MLCPIAEAEIYQWTDANGQTHFSDSAPKNRPDIKPKELIIPTAIPATKVAPKPKEKSGPTVIEIGSPEPDTGCNSQRINSINQNAVLDAWQDSEWKACHGMH